MKIDRTAWSFLVAAITAVASFPGTAAATPMSYNLTFVTSSGADTFAGMFTYDAANQMPGQTTFDNFTVWVNGDTTMPYTDQSPTDDSVTVNVSGQVTALNVDLGPPPMGMTMNEPLQLNLDGTFTFMPSTGGTDSGTYAVMGVPEPATAWLAACALPLVFVLRRRYRA